MTQEDTRFCRAAKSRYSLDARDVSEEWIQASGVRRMDHRNACLQLHCPVTQLAQRISLHLEILHFAKQYRGGLPISYYLRHFMLYFIFCTILNANDYWIL